MPPGRFALLQHADHLPPLNQPRHTLELIHAFVNAQPLAFPWLLTNGEARNATRERRLNPRYPGAALPLTVENKSGRRWSGVLQNLSPHGALIEAPGLPAEAMADEPMTLHIGGPSPVSTLAVFWSQAAHARAQFVVTSLDNFAGIEGLYRATSEARA